MSTILPVKIETSINPSFLRYDWKISRKSRILTQPATENHQYKEYILLSVTNQPLNGNSMTQSHNLSMTVGDKPTTLYISEIKVYLAKETNCDNAETFSGIYTLQDIQKGKIHINDTDKPSFKTSSGTTSQNNNHTVSCQISREKRAFFCNSILTEEAYYQGNSHPNDPFAKTKMATQIKNRLNYPYPFQDRTSLCGPASFYYCLLKE